VVAEGGSRCCFSLGDGLGVQLLPGVLPVEELQTKHPLLFLAGSKIVVVVPGDFLG
jgi:hypothetical protein